MSRGSKKRFKLGTQDDLIEKFAAVFHSFGDLHKVAPITFLARLKRRGVILAQFVPAQKTTPPASPKQQRG